MPAENIFAAYAQPVRSVLDYQGEMDKRDLLQTQLAGARRQNAIADLTAVQTQDTMRQAALERDALRAAAAKAGGDPKSLIGALRSTGMPGLLMQADTLEKGLIERAKGEAAAGKDTAETEATRAKTAKARRDEAIQHIGSFATPDEAIASLNGASDIPMQMRMQLINGIQSAAQKGPAGFREWQLRTVLALASPEKQVEGMKPQMLNAGGSFVNANPLAVGAAPIPITQSADNAANNATTMRGQNMVDARTREANAISREANQSVYDSERGIVVNRGTAAAKPIVGSDGKPLGAKDKPLNDTQAKALLFGQRMKEADSILGQLANDGVTQPSLIKRTAEGVPLIGGALGTGANFIASGKQQQVDQAQRDFINAVLRRESGAAIANTEFDSAARQYFPQPGDSPDVIKQKARNRANATALMLAEVPAGTKVPELQTAASVEAANNAAIEAALNKYLPKAK